jgi:hypothetical protein
VTILVVGIFLSLGDKTMTAICAGLLVLQCGAIAISMFCMRRDRTTEDPANSD